MIGDRIGGGFTRSVLANRRRYVDEEHREVVEAFAAVRAEVEACGPSEASVSDAARHLAQELVDLTYVIVGTFVELGIDPEPVWRAVHEANMRKQPSPGGGKAVKPPGWLPPDIPLLPMEAAVRT
jgi:predicted HAD superfamily Cof-like phosphohydrolase